MSDKTKPVESPETLRDFAPSDVRDVRVDKFLSASHLYVSSQTSGACDLARSLAFWRQQVDRE